MLKEEDRPLLHDHGLNGDIKHDHETEALDEDNNHNDDTITATAKAGDGAPPLSGLTKARHEDVITEDEHVHGHGLPYLQHCDNDWKKKSICG